METKNQWWGYLHTNGNIQVKPAIWDINDMLADARESPFCERVFEPFEAENREEAIKIISEKLK